MKYLSGFGSHHETEAVAGALPVGRNSPQKVPFGLYAEQLSGIVLHRAARAEPALVALSPAALGDAPAVPAASTTALVRTAPCREAECPPNRLRWAPLPMPGAADRLPRRASRRSPPAATRARSTAAACTCMRATARWQERASSTTPTASCCIVPQEGALDARHRVRACSRWRPARSRSIPRGVQVPRRASTAPGARLRVRELRRAAAPARAGAHRLQRPRQSARFPRARRGVRGPRRAHGGRREVRRPPVGARSRRIRRSTSSRGTATTTRTSTTSRASTR